MCVSVCMRDGKRKKDRWIARYRGTHGESEISRAGGRGIAKNKERERKRARAR